VFELPDGKHVIAFGDVSGKGTAAALYGGLVSGLLRTLAPRRRRPAELMRALNDTLGERKVDARYVTLCVMLWDPISREIVMANAGAIPPMICRGSEILNIRVEGVPLGLLDDREYEEVPFQAQSGDTLVLYSDGITDHLNAAGTEFGRGRRFLPTTLAQMLPALLGTPDRPVIAVHRIDRDTSGLVVFARTPAAADSLSRQFRKHGVERRYLALTRGTPTVSRIESVLVRDRGDGRRGSSRKTNPPDGKRAVTHVKLLEHLGDFAAVECRLETGRTHQVRIHLGEAGAPLCGERVYDRPVNGRPAPDGSSAARPMLHAARLGFLHPETGQAMTWDAKPPDDFVALWSKLRG